MTDPERLTPFFGDYPHGLHWSALGSDGRATSDSETSHAVEGSILRVMWDESAGPLWASDGLLPDDPQWLKRALGLSESLVADLLTWLADMTPLHWGPSVADWEQRLQRLDAQGQHLAERLQTEVGSQYRVSYKN